jgi:hypothetical protein
LDSPRRTCYGWLKEARARALRGERVKPTKPYEALAEEKQAVLEYARKRPGLRHRELAWRMADEDVACLSPATVYRILKEANRMPLEAAREAAARGRPAVDKAAGAVGRRRQIHRAGVFAG